MSSNPSRRTTVTDPAAVALLLNPTAARKLAPFFEAEQTLSTASAVIGCSPSTLAYWLPRFVSCGLLVERSQRRGGMAMRWYRTPTPTLFIPHRSLSPGQVLDYFVAGRQRVLERGTDSLVHRLTTDAGGVVFTASEPDGIDMDLSPPLPERAQPAIEFWGTLRLTAEQRSQLVAELNDVVGRYRDLGGARRGAREVVVHLGAVPVKAGSARQR